MPGQFHLTGKVQQVTKDSGDVGIDQDITVATGWTGTLTSNYPKGAALPDGDDVTYIDVRTITLLGDGNITEDGVNAGISLTAHDPDLFDVPLQWTLKPGPVTLTSGKTLRPRPWTFNANLDGVALTLGDATPVAAQEMTSTARGPRAFTTYFVPVPATDPQTYSQHDINGVIPGSDPITLDVTPFGATTVPTFTVDPFYGGTLGGSDDTTCIQNTIDACKNEGGGIVFLPPNVGVTRWKAEQLIMRDGVKFMGAGWHSYALDGYFGGTKLQQLTGVNDDFIIFDRAGATQWVIGFGISDISLRGAVGSTGGHAISLRNSLDVELGMQDLSTLNNIYGVGFAGSVIKATKGAPFHASNICGNGQGGYIIEVVDGGAMTQVILENISGDGNLGYGGGFSGAAVYLGNIDNPFGAAVTIMGVKSEYRARESIWPNGDGTSWGNFNAVVIEDCTRPISITGVSHIGYHPTTKPGNAVQVIGSVPDLHWAAVSTAPYAGQTVGPDPVAVYDAVNSRAYSTPHGVIGAAGFTADKLKLRTGLFGLGGNRLLETTNTVSPAGDPDNYVGVYNSGAGGTPGLYSEGVDTNVGFDIASKGSDPVTINSSPALTPAVVHAATGKTTPVDADEIPLVDSAASFGLKKLTWANLKATLKTYFDSLATTLTNKTLTDPKINSIKDVNGNNWINASVWSPSATNYLEVESSPTGNFYVGLYAKGSADANIDMAIIPKGTGALQVNAVTGGASKIKADGPDTDHNVNVIPKGAGRLQENGNIAATWVGVPGSHTATGKQGQQAADSTALYICYATNLWGKITAAGWTTSF